MKRIILSIITLVSIISLMLIPSSAAATIQCMRITTLPAYDIASNQATLAVTITDMGECTLASVIFEYGTSHGIYDRSINAGSVTASGTKTVVLTGLNAATTYYVRPKVTCLQALSWLPPGTFGAGTDLNQFIRPSLQYIPFICFVDGAEISFTTLAVPWLNPGQSGGGNSGGTGNSATGTTTPSNITVRSATLSAPKVGLTEPVTVKATVSNTGGVNGSKKITVYVNGEEAASQGVTLTSGEIRDISFTLSRSEPGVYNVIVNNQPAGSFTVDYFTNNDVLIYGLISIFAVGIGVMLFLVTRRRQTA